MGTNGKKTLTPQELTAWRERLEFSQRDAADAVGCDRGAWAGWEGGEQRIPHYIGLAIAALGLGIDPYFNPRAIKKAAK